MTTDPHQGWPVLHTGERPADARAAMILVHGRGASADDMMGLAREVFDPEVAYFAPQAANHTWYPYSFLSPLAQNEPYLTSALGVLESLLGSLALEGIPPERVLLLGFSQGACLSVEFAARHARRYAAIVGLSGGLIGPDGTDRSYAGSLDGTPVLLGCSDRDAHVPVSRVHETTAVLTRLGALVDERIYPGLGHTINEDEIAAVRALLQSTGVQKT